MDPQEKLFKKQQNIYRLHELVDGSVMGVRAADAHLLFSEALVKRMHAVAMTGLMQSPGEYRSGEVRINNSAHVCPSWVQVPALMGTLVEYVSKNWAEKDLVHLCAFVLWRLNWIHPFANGNGRTARASSYLVLCAKNGRLFPPKNSIIEQIQRDKQPYYGLLREADVIFERTQNIEAALANFEGYLGTLLARQLEANF